MPQKVHKKTDERASLLKIVSRFAALVYGKIKDKVLETIAVFVIGIVIAFFNPLYELYQEQQEKTKKQQLQEQREKELAENIRKLTGESHTIASFHFSEKDSATYILAKKQLDNKIYYYSSIGKLTLYHYAVWAPLHFDYDYISDEDPEPDWPPFQDQGFFTLEGSGRTFWYTVYEQEGRAETRLGLAIYQLNGSIEIDVIHEIKHPNKGVYSWIEGSDDLISLSDYPDIELIAWVHNYLDRKKVAENSGIGSTAWESYNYGRDLSERLLPAIGREHVKYWCQVDGGYGWNIELTTTTVSMAFADRDVGLLHYVPEQQRSLYVYQTHSSYYLDEYIILANDELALFFLWEERESNIWSFEYVKLLFNSDTYYYKNSFNASSSYPLEKEELAQIRTDIEALKAKMTYCYFDDINSKPTTYKKTVKTKLDEMLAKFSKSLR